jgi:hypothetical protein
MKLARLLLIPLLVTLPSACQLIGALPRSRQAVSNSNSQQKQSTPKKKANTGPEYNAYVSAVRKEWANNNYVWLEKQAKALRASKERLPGGEWKLHVLYRSIERMVDTESSDEAWQEHIARVEEWRSQSPTSVMPRIVLAEVWRAYAFKVRGTDYARNVKPDSWAPFYERLHKTNEMLAEAFNLEERCPELYLTALQSALGQTHDRKVFEEVYEEGITIEPTYFYLYSAKTIYLLPQWYGEPGEWERFAEIAANRVGGEQGDIILFNIYTDRMANANLDFMNKHRAIAPRVLAGFRAIDRLYGSSPVTLNEACLISFFTDDQKAPAELMKRIGNEYDLSVWRDESTFSVHRQEALMRIGELPRYRPRSEVQKQ